MRVAVVQLASSTDSDANRRLVADRLGAIASDVDLVVLPEAAMHDFGSPDHDLAAAAEPLDGPFVQLLAEHARRLGATVVAGMFEESAGDLPFNTLVALGPDGSLLGSYRKIHLYDSFGYKESDRLVAGEPAPLVLDVAGTRVGLMTCYDLRFPEMARLLVDSGAEVVVVPAAWVAGDLKLHHWRTLLTARAIEDLVHVVAAAQGGERYTGHSLVLDPQGQVLAEAGPDEVDGLRVDLDPSAVAQARHTNPSLANRRLEVRV
ncbi:hydrolase [Aeromicrobium sp. Root495]|uniref:carbon-nitrogen hydrolase family protein n=1 Tax=Aeromicrobium sp. Root495 TaxID=1736550 RepID=UPI0006F7DEDE|nr:carbon-nitrogen hydrolase family protein [Aeromicrobium sp. Root495]KQY56198.1 hydrolase [Aeromicrobium sp. Root495]RYJ06186.1 MAG: carbon-nitrogen hydrolase family protein [Actinomycetales bacterium]